MTGWDPFSEGTNGWDTLSETAKIVLPALLTATAGFYGGRITRASDDSRERRRRRQDVIERSSEQFALLADAMVSLMSGYVQFCAEIAQKPLDFESPATGARLRGFKERLDKAQAAKLDLQLVDARLNLLALHKCGQSISSYMDACISAFNTLDMAPANPQEASELAKKSVGELHASRKTVQDALSAAYLS